MLHCSPRNALQKVLYQNGLEVCSLAVIDHRVLMIVLAYPLPRTWVIEANLAALSLQIMGARGYLDEASVKTAYFQIRS
jgi:hypothetical protein